MRSTEAVSYVERLDVRLRDLEARCRYTWDKLCYVRRERAFLDRMDGLGTSEQKINGLKSILSSQLYDRRYLKRLRKEILNGD